MGKRTYTILIIDSGHREYSGRLRESLKGCRIITQPDHFRACEYFCCKSVDLVLLDHDNDSSCIAMVEFFRSQKPFAPILIMTDKGSEEFAISIFRHGAKDYFRKPFSVTELRKGICDALDITLKRNSATINGLKRALEYIHFNSHTKMKLQHVAREAGMSVSCLNKKFKKEKGVTFTQYLNAVRIRCALELLRNNDLSMNDISFACGFTNQFHFSRVFKKIMKVSPSAYKRSIPEQAEF